MELDRPPSRNLNRPQRMLESGSLKTFTGASLSRVLAFGSLRGNELFEKLESQLD